MRPPSLLQSDICRAGCPHPAAERHHKIVPPAHVTARPTGRCKHRPLQISFSVRGKILPFFPFNTFSSSSSYKKRAQRPIFIGAVRVLLTPNFLRYLRPNNCRKHQSTPCQFYAGKGLAQNQPAGQGAEHAFHAHGHAGNGGVKFFLAQICSV